MEWSKIELETLKKYYPSTKNKDILKMFPTRSMGSIRGTAERHGLKKDRSVFQAGKGTLAGLLQETNEAYYWVGYLMADGYIHHSLGQVVLASDYKDYDHLKRFAEFLGVEAKVYKQSKSGFRKVDGKQVRVSVAQKVICNKIVDKFDFKKNKTYNPPDIDILNNALNNKEKFLHFFCGFFDGDGCINATGDGKAEIHKNWSGIIDFFLKKLFYYQIIDKPRTSNIRGDYASFPMSKYALSKIKKICKKFCLARKWRRVDENYIPNKKHLDRIEKIKEYHSQGLTIAEMSNKIGIDQNSVRSYARNHNIKLNIKKYERKK